jgi:hypothetical protein
MSSPAEQFPSDPDDPRDTPHAGAGAGAGGGSGGADAGAHEQARRRRLSLQEQAQATLARKVAKAAKAHRGIAKATAKRARALEELRAWSSEPVTAQLLNPDYASAGPTGAGPELADADASQRKVPAWEDQEIARRTVTTEIACALHLAERTAENLIGEAMLFAGPMVATLTAMRRGQISYRHGQVLMEQLSFLPVEEAQQFEATLLPLAKELTPGRLAVKARRLRERAHPDTLTPRVARAVQERGVWWEGRDDGMATLTWYGTAEQTLAAQARLTRIVAAAADSENNDPNLPAEQRRTISQLCADAMADLLLTGISPTGTGTGITGTVLITVPVLTALGTGTEPGFLDGYGPVPAHTAREIAAGAPSFSRLLTHPETGAVLSVGRDRYSVPADLRRWLRLRDGSCRFPGCARPATRSDIDHIRAWQHGGPTDHDNLAHLCAAHHRLKHRTLWAVDTEPNGVLRWTSPGGHTHRTHPETTLGPPPALPPKPEPPTPSARVATTDEGHDGQPPF